MSARQWVRPEVQAMSAYVVQDASGLIKLDAMENPFPLPPELAEELGKRLAAAALNRYPDAAASELVAALRQAFSLPREMQVLLGNGSDELIQIMALAVAKPGAALLSVEPAFVMFRHIAELVGLRYIGLPLKADFSLDEAAIIDAVNTHQPAIIFLACPNNPTGNLFDLDAVERIAKAAHGLVVVDEAYTAFSRESFLSRMGRHPNVVLMRTLSKLGLAGLRVGYLTGTADWLQEFEKVRLPYNINVLTQTAARFALEHIEVLNGQARTLVAERTSLHAALAAVPGVTVYPSEANFLLFRVGDAEGVFTRLKSRKILVKNVSRAHPLLAGCLRVSLGTPAENAAFMDALKASL